MKITNGLMGKLLGRQNSPIDLNKNEIYSANIKTRFSNNEGMVQIKGREFKVKFQGSMPKENRVNIKVTNMKDDVFTVKTVNPDNTQSQGENNISKMITKYGFKPTPELRQAAKALVNSGGTITRETLKNLENFISKGEGTFSDKIETIEAMAKKGIEITPANIESVHEALHGGEIDEVLSELSRNVDSQTVDKGVNNPKAESMNEAQVLKEVLNEMKELIKNNGDLEEIEKLINNKITDKDLLAKLSKALQTAKALENVGFKEAGLSKLSQMLDQLEGGLLNIDSMEQTLEQSLSNIEPSKKAFVMTKVTERMSVATEKFTDMKREVIRNIDTIINVTKGTKSNVHSHVKGILENSIDTLDKAILKSDITLFADMKTEKELLGLSGKLAQARKLLAKGQNSEATKVFNEVKNKLMKLNYKPSQEKVIHGATKESLLTSNGSIESRVTNNLMTALNNFQSGQPSAKSAFDLFRALGLNYDTEVAQKLVGNLEHTSEQDLKKNLKAMLLKLSESKGEGLKDSASNQSVVKALNNITGQQLLSKQDGNSHQQNMFFNIPLKMGDELKNVKLFINGRKENEKIDWENSSLYFLIDTDKMGPTGISISSTDRNLSITIKNDNKTLEHKVGSMSSNLKDKLSDIGYNVLGLKFAELNNREKEETRKEKPNTKFEMPDRLNKKGFDLKI